MKNISHIFVIIGVCFVMAGCGVNEKEEYATNVEKVNQAVTESQVKNNDVVQEYSEDDLSVKLGEINKSDNQVSDDVEKERPDECDEGFIYHTELKECFKVGGVIDSDIDKVEIDPVVQECDDNGGIYNAQIEKCFID